MGPMTRVVGPIVVLLLSLAGCGDAPPTVVPASPSCTCYAWEGPSEGSSLRVDDFGAWVKLAIHADGTYEVYHSGIQGYGGYDSGRWAAKDGKITFVPDMWSSGDEWRRFYWTRYEAGVSVEWVRSPRNSPAASARGGWEPDENQPPERTVSMHAIPCGDLPARLAEMRAEEWASYLTIYPGSPFKHEDDEDDR